MRVAKEVIIEHTQQAQADGLREHTRVRSVCACQEVTGPSVTLVSLLRSFTKTKKKKGTAKKQEVERNHPSRRNVKSSTVLSSSSELCHCHYHTAFAFCIAFSFNIGAPRTLTRSLVSYSRNRHTTTRARSVRALWCLPCASAPELGRFRHLPGVGFALVGSVWCGVVRLDHFVRPLSLRAAIIGG